MTSIAFRIGLIEGMAHYADCGEIKPACGWFQNMVSCMGGPGAFLRIGAPVPKSVDAKLDENTMQRIADYERGCDAGVRIASRMNAVDVVDHSNDLPPQCALKKIDLWITKKTLDGVPLEIFGAKLKDAYAIAYPGADFTVYLGGKSCVSFLTHNTIPDDFNPEATSNHVESIAQATLNECQKAYWEGRDPCRNQGQGEAQQAPPGDASRG